MCDYCETVNGRSEIFTKGGFWYDDDGNLTGTEEDNVYLTTDDEGGCLVRGREVYSEDDCWELEADSTWVIHYCPFCGRPLAKAASV